MTNRLILFLSILLISYNANAGDLILPDCEDEHLIRQVISEVREFQTTQKAESIIERRRQQLTLRNLEKFKEVQHRGFTAAQDFNTANQLLMTKINKGISDDQIRLCQADTEGLASKVHLIIYHHNGEYRINVTNIAPDGKTLTVIY